MRITLNRRQAARLAASIIGLSTWSLESIAADKPMRLIVPLDAGSTPDAVARALSVPLAKVANQPVIVDDLPGAGGVLGTSQLVRSPKDGQTLAMVASNHVISPSIYSNVPYDAVNDVTPLTLVGASPFVLVVHKAVPVKNLQELIALAKTQPGRLSYGSSGIGTAFHLAGALLESEAGISLMHVPYKGTSPMVNDLIGGQVQMAFVAAPVIAPYIASGAVKPIGVTSAARMPTVRDIPTFAEQGLKNYEFGAWLAVIAPAGLPPEVVSRRHAELKTVISSAEFRDWLLGQGFTPQVSTPEATRQFFQSELAKYAKLVKQTGAKAP